MCRLCGGTDLRTLVDLGMSPLCESFLAELSARRGRAVLSVARAFVRGLPACPARGLRSGDRDLSRLLLLLLVLRLLGRHARRYTEMITERLWLTSDSLVVELASNDGYLLQHFVARGCRCSGSIPRRTSPMRRRRGVEIRASRLLRLEARARGSRRTAAAPTSSREQRACTGSRAQRLRLGLEIALGRRTGWRRRVAASRAPDRGAAVRHDLPRALFVLLAGTRLIVSSPRTASSLRRRGAASHGGSLRPTPDG